MIATERLELVPATVALTRAALAGAPRLSAALGVEVPPAWPHRYLDAAAFEFTIAALERSPAQHGWWMYFVVLRGDAGEAPVLIGTAGYKGPPAEGTVEVGYGIVASHHRRGYASEAVRGLLAHAFSFETVSCVIAETLPELLQSTGVLHKCGFRFSGSGAEPGAIRFELTREAYCQLTSEE